MRLHKTSALILFALTAAMPSCHLPGYARPADGWLATDSSGRLQVSAKKLSKKKTGFRAILELRNLSTEGLLLPLDRISSKWGQIVATVEIDGGKRFIRKLPIVFMRSGNPRQGILADTDWVTPVGGSGSRVGQALYIGPNKHLEVPLLCSLPVTSSGDITVKFENLSHGSPDGRVTGPIDEPLVWTAKETPSKTT